VFLPEITLPVATQTCFYIINMRQQQDPTEFLPNFIFSGTKVFVSRSQKIPDA
jgi:hypothetical protein